VRGHALVNREYDIFEQFPDGFPVWRGYASGLAAASAKLAELAKQTSNECFLICLPTKEVVARLNVGARKLGQKRIVCQIGYETQLGAERAALLRLSGYEVVSIFGNDAARVILTTTVPRCDAFIVGHGAPQEIRHEMLLWLKDRFPRTPVVVMNGPGIGPLAGADYNVKLNGPEAWLPIIATAVRVSSAAP
jgi:hypothetical protein